VVNRSETAVTLDPHKALTIDRSASAQRRNGGGVCVQYFALVVSMTVRRSFGAMVKGNAMAGVHDRGCASHKDGRGYFRL
jgi:hypothetical protein